MGGQIDITWRGSSFGLLQLSDEGQLATRAEPIVPQISAPSKKVGQRKGEEQTSPRIERHAVTSHLSQEEINIACSKAFIARDGSRHLRDGESVPVDERGYYRGPTSYYTGYYKGRYYKNGRFKW